MMTLVIALSGGVLLLLGTAMTVAGTFVLGMIDRLRTRVDHLEVRERIRDDYIIVLRRHIEEGKPPPPPPYPMGLINE